MRLHLGCLLLLLATAACSDDAPRPETLVVARPGDALSLDPAAITDNESMEVATQIFEGLVRYKERSMQVEPALATHWEASPQGTQWLFHLRRGVRFHDGTVFDADAVVFSFERQRDAMHPFHFESFPYWENTFRNIVGVEKVDRHTVRISIVRPYAPFLTNLAMFPVSIVSPTAVRRYGRGFAQHPVGTGPFRFVRWERGVQIVLARQDSYWGSAARVGQLSFRVVRDAEERLLGLQSGTIDVAHALAPEDRHIVRLHADLRLYRVPGQNVAYLAMNTQRPPLDSVLVRRAINHAIDKEALVKLVYQGLAVSARGPLPPQLWGVSRTARRYGYDPQIARRLLKQAGFDATRPLRLRAMTTPRPYMPNPELATRMVARNLAAVGIKVDVLLQPHGVHLAAVRAGDHDLCLLGWAGDNGDPDNFLYVLFDRDNARPGTAQNVAFFTNARVHDLLVRAQVESRQAVREPLYHEAQEIIADEAPWVPLAHSDIVVAAQRRVRDLHLHPSTTILYRRAAIVHE